MDCGLPRQSKVFAFCAVAFKLYGKGRFVRQPWPWRATAPYPLTPALQLGVLRFDSCCVCFRSAQFEHTVLITSGGVEILTKLPQEA